MFPAMPILYSLANNPFHHTESNAFSISKISIYNHHSRCLPLVLPHSHVDFTAQKPENNKILKTCKQKLFFILFLFFEPSFARAAHFM